MTPQSTPASIASASPLHTHSRRTLFVIFGAALLGRLLALWFTITGRPHNWLFSHPWEMGFLANTLLHGQGYSNPFGFPTGPTAFIAPGYPTLIAGIFFVFGTYSFASAIVIMLLQTFVGLGTIWLIMHLANRLFDARTATIAGAFWAVSLPLLWVPEIFWESAISECALIGMVALALRYQRAPTATTWVLVGACCAVITLINPALIFSLLAILGWLAWHTRTSPRKGALLGLLAFLLIFSVWPIRNAYRFHAFIPLRSTVGFELWMGNRPGANGRLDESVFPMFDKRELASYVAKGEVAYTREKSAEAWAYIRSHPRVFTDLTLRRFYRFWAGTGNVNSSPVYEIHALLTSIFGLAGLFLMYRLRMRAPAILFAIPLLLFPVPYYITHAEFRYRLNIDPLLTVLAAFAVSQLVSAAQKRLRRAKPVQPNPNLAASIRD